MADHVVHVVQGKVTVFPGNFEYFLRRQAQLDAEAAKNRPEPTAAQKAESEAENLYEASKEACRRAKSLEKATAELERLHAELERIAHEMSDPKLYEDFDRVTKVGEEMETVQASIQLKEEEVKRLTA